MSNFTFSMPPPNGVHQWLFGQVRVAQLKGFPPEYIRETFRSALNAMFANGILKRNPSDRDLDQAIGNIFATADQPPTPPGPLSYDPDEGWCESASTLKPVLDQALVDRALSESPVKTVADIPKSTGHWHNLYKPTDLLCVGAAADSYQATTAGQLKDYPDAQFIVPNPLRKRLGRAKNGRLTAHCRDAVGPRRYIIMENDHGLSPNDQVAILFWVSEKTETPLRLIVSSSNKSVHGWFDVSGASEEVIYGWVKSAVRIGFDPRLILPEQFVRFPGGWRPDKQARQEILYTNC